MSREYNDIKILSGVRQKIVRAEKYYRYNLKIHPEEARQIILAIDDRISNLTECKGAKEASDNIKELR